MSIEKGRAYFRQFGMEDRVQEFPVSSATVERHWHLALKAQGLQRRFLLRRVIAVFLSSQQAMPE